MSRSCWTPARPWSTRPRPATTAPSRSVRRPGGPSRTRSATAISRDDYRPPSPRRPPAPGQVGPTSARCTPPPTRATSTGPPALVNELLERTGARPRLTHTETGWDLHFHGPDQTVARGWAAGLAAGLALALGSDRGGRLGVCAAEPCDRVFIDTSRNGGAGSAPRAARTASRPPPTDTGSDEPGGSSRAGSETMSGAHRRWARVGGAQRRAGPHRTRSTRNTAVTSRPVVLIAEELSPATVEALGPDFEIRHCNGADRAELLPAIADVDAILVRSATKVDAEALAAAKQAQGRRPRRRRPRQRRREGLHPGRRDGRQRPDLQHRLAPPSSPSR